jgi:hypothetical protein
MAVGDEPIDGKTAADKMLEEAWVNLQQARWQLHKEMTDGQITDGTRRELAVATLALWDCISSERDNNTVAEEIRESHIPELRNMTQATTSVAESGPGRGSQGNVREVPLVTQASFDLLEQVSREVMDIASELGKGLTVTESRPIYHAGKRDPEDYEDPVDDAIPKPQ